MAIGDQTDMFGRLKNLLPAGWFGDNNPVRDALLWGYANALAWGYTLYLYAKSQTRIKSAADGWLDLIGLDFFGSNLIRYSNQADTSYRTRVLINLFRERTTRHAMEQMLFDLTGRWPIIVEPARPADVGSYGAAVAVSRASTATYLDLNGRIATADVNVARYDVDPITGVGRLLIEGAATNSYLYSQDITNPAWGKSAGSASTAGTFIGIPFGRFTPDTSNGTHAITRTLTMAAGSTVVLSWVAKADGYQRLSLRVAPGGVLAGRVLFDVLTGTITQNNAGIPASITPLANGFFRIAVTFTLGPGATSAGANLEVANTANGITFAGDGVSGILISAAQAEYDTLTSYIPTISTALSRAADILLGNMPAGSIAIGGYGVAGAYGSVLLPYQAFITAFRPNGQGLPFVSGYGISTGAYSAPSRSSYGKLSVGDVTDADIYAAIDATKPIGTVAWTRISS